LHVIPPIGSVKMAKLRPLHVQRVVDRALGSGLAPRTVAGAYRVLHSALGQACRWQVLAVNSASAVKPPRADRTEVKVPDTATVERILAAARGTRLYDPLALIAATGMRRGEALGLRWASVDLEA